MVPYSKGLCESYRTICSKYDVQVYFKEGNTLKNLLMFPKDKESITKQNDIIYWFKCGTTECDDKYTGESARTFEERYREHLKALCSKLVISVIEHRVEVVDKLSSTAVVFFRSERILKCKCLYGA